jgi:hypothetical protein
VILPLWYSLTWLKTSIIPAKLFHIDQALMPPLLLVLLMSSMTDMIYVSMEHFDLGQNLLKLRQKSFITSSSGPNFIKLSTTEIDFRNKLECLPLASFSRLV